MECRYERIYRLYVSGTAVALHGTEDYGTEGMALGMCFGVAIGTSLGNNTGIGLAIGMLLGLAIGSGIEKKDSE